MGQSKKALVIVASVLGLLALAPLCALLLFKGPALNTSVHSSVGRSPESPSAPASYELQALQSRVTALLEHELSEAVQQQKISLKKMAHLQELRDKGALAMQRGRWDQAQQSYQLLEQTAGAELERVRMMEDCAQMEQTLYQLLEHLKPFQAIFEQTYQQLVNRYDQAGIAYQNQQFESAVKLYAEAIDQANAARVHAEAHVDALIESGKRAMDALDLEQAGQHYRAALKRMPKLVRAQDALLEIVQLQSVKADLQMAKVFEDDRQWDAALAVWERLLQRFPKSTLFNKRVELTKEKLLGAQVADLLEQAERALAVGEVSQAIERLQSADTLQPSPMLQARVQKLQAQLRAQELKQKLQAAFQLLEVGQYAQARRLYAELKDAYPKNAEVQAGLEQASRLNLASIHYRQNIQSSERYYAAGKFPLAIQFFNAALSSRPSHMNAVDRDREAKLDERLKAQLQPQSLDLLSDGRTHVSVVGVLAPAQFERKPVSLQPDVYQIKGERPGYKSVELELKLNADQVPEAIRVVCGEKL
jgi:tetratricopeptide (TPR) repeat protein